MVKVFVEHGSPSYVRFFHMLGMETTDSVEEAELVCFIGGADVDPSLYGAEAHHTTNFCRNTDYSSIVLFNETKENNVPCVGICRGAQFLNVMCGGDMYQNVTGHVGSHLATDLTTKYGIDGVTVTSTHHQMMLPMGNFEHLCDASHECVKTYYCKEKEEFVTTVDNTSYESVIYPEHGCLCFQPHPEFFNRRGSSCVEMFVRHLKILMKTGEV